MPPLSQVEAVLCLVQVSRPKTTLCSGRFRPLSFDGSCVLDYNRGCWDMHGCHSSGAVLCPESPISECTAAAGCRLRWLLLNRVQRPVQDEWQGETRLRFKLRLCLRRRAHSAVQGRASDARGCRFRLQRECAANVRTFEPRRVPIAVEVHGVVALLG